MGLEMTGRGYSLLGLEMTGRGYSLLGLEMNRRGYLLLRLEMTRRGYLPLGLEMPRRIIVSEIGHRNMTILNFSTSSAASPPSAPSTSFT